MKARTSTVVASCFLILAAMAARAFAAEAPRVVDIVVDRSVVVPLTSASHVVVVDENICRAEVERDALRVTALRRGETILIAWRGDERETWLVRVAGPAPAAPQTRATPAELDAAGHGTIGSLAHVGTSSRGTARSVSLLTPFAWTEGSANRRFSMNGQMQGARADDAGMVTLDTLSAQWLRGDTTVQILDVVVNLDGGPAAQIAPAGSPASFALRGADVLVVAGKNSYETFGGTTLPWFAASRQLAGFTIARQVNDRVRLDGTTAAVRAPVMANGVTVGHQATAFQTFGVTDRISERSAFRLRAGAGNNGYHAEAAAAREGERVTAYLSAARSSPQFGLNQLQLVYAPSVVVQGGANLGVTARFRSGVGYSHTTTQPTPLFPAHSSSDYATQTLSFMLTRNHTVFSNATWNRNVGGLGIAGRQFGRRLDAGISSQFSRGAANHAQMSLGALADPLEVNARSEFSLRDDVTITMRSASLNVSVSHNRLSASLVTRLRQQLNLLAPGLQPLFLDDPIAFVQSPLMPTDVRELLNALEPVDTQASVSGLFHIGSRLTLNPTFSYLHHTQTTSLATANQMIGYSLTWRATPTLELQSTLTNALIFDPRQADLARTTVFGIGFRKTLNGAPRWIAPSAGYQIRGRVFRDGNIDGTAAPEEPGIAGVLVRLSDGRTARTDDHGRFQFGGLASGEYRLLLPLDQLGPGVRVTTPIDPVVRLYERRAVDVDFGVVNFSRITGVVFNDLALSGLRQADAPGLRGVVLAIDGNGAVRRVRTDAAGEFEVDDLTPGRYRITIDASTLPSNCEAGTGAIDVEVAPSSTATVGVPIRALRSISGRVFWRAAGGAPAPLRGVTVSAHSSTAVTDDEGRFLLRNLPAGDLTVEVLPASPLPQDLTVPTGHLRMSAQPTQIEGATIVIENPRLLEYLTSPIAGGPSPKGSR